MDDVSRFFWEVLGDLVYEDDHGLVEIYWHSKTFFGNEDPEQRRAIAIEVLNSLLEQEFVELFDSEEELTGFESSRARALIEELGADPDAPTTELLRIFVRATPIGERAVKNR